MTPQPKSRLVFHADEVVPLTRHQYYLLNDTYDNVLLETLHPQTNAGGHWFRITLRDTAEIIATVRLARLEYAAGLHFMGDIPCRDNKILASCHVLKGAQLFESLSYLYGLLEKEGYKTRFSNAEKFILSI